MPKKNGEKQIKEQTSAEYCQKSEDDANGGDDHPGQGVAGPLSWFLGRWKKWKRLKIKNEKKWKRLGIKDKKLKEMKNIKN